jgi:hypothetical protein
MHPTDVVAGGSICMQAQLCNSWHHQHGRLRCIILSGFLFAVVFLLW